MAVGNNRVGHISTPNSSFQWLHFCSRMSYPVIYKSVVLTFQALALRQKKMKKAKSLFWQMAFAQNVRPRIPYTNVFIFQFVFICFLIYVFLISALKITSKDNKHLRNTNIAWACNKYIQRIYTVRCINAFLLSHFQMSCSQIQKNTALWINGKVSSRFFDY